MNSSQLTRVTAVALACLFTLMARPTAAMVFVRGDVNVDGTKDLSDAALTLRHVFLGEEIGCKSAADYNDDSQLDMQDAIQGLMRLFLDGEPPRAPYPECGMDPTPDSLGCESFETCSEPAGVTLAKSGDVGTLPYLTDDLLARPDIRETLREWMIETWGGLPPRLDVSNGPAVAPTGSVYVGIVIEGHLTMALVPDSITGSVTTHVPRCDCENLPDELPEDADVAFDGGFGGGSPDDQDERCSVDDIGEAGVFWGCESTGCGTDQTCILFR